MLKRIHDSGFKFSQMEMSELNIQVSLVYSHRPSTNEPYSEVVLATLLANYKFELPKEKIVWNMSGIIYPSVGTDKAEMPLKVTKVKSTSQ